LLYVWMLFGIDQHDAVLVEQALVAGHEDVEIAAVLEREPGAAAGENAGVGSGRGVERSAPGWADTLVPGTCLLADVDAGDLPEVEFGDMGAGAVAARDEGRALGFDGLQSLGDVGHALDAGRVALRPDQDEIVVHHGVSFDAETVGDEFLLLGLGMRVSASPRRPVSSAWPVPCATTFTSMPVLALNSGRMWPNRPESCVDVVEATTMDLSCARAGAAATSVMVAAKRTR